MMKTPTNGPLAGLRVLDMTRVIAGPLAGQYLADYGADVIKVEKRGEGDEARKVGPPWLKDGQGQDTKDSTYFQTANRGKRAIDIDFAKPEGAQLVRDLALQSDIFLENYRPGTLAKYGLGYADLSKLNERLIYCSVTGFGQDGPYASRSGYDYLVQGMSGVMALTGTPEGGPTRVGIPIADISTGLHAVIGILAALNKRHATGKGQWLDIGLFDCQFGMMLNPVAAWFNSGVALKSSGNSHPSACPHAAFQVADGQIIIAIFSDAEFGRLCQVLGHPEWARDERFASNGLRVQHRQLLEKCITEVLLTDTRSNWVDRFNAAKVCAGPINQVSDLDGNPQVLARRMIVEQPHPVAGSVKSIANPVKFSDGELTYALPAPAQGQHTNEVLREMLGLAPEAIELLRLKQVI